MITPRHRYLYCLLSLAVSIVCIGSASPADDADEAKERRFGRLLLKALTIIEEEHFNPPPKLDMARLGIEALYANFGRRLPPDLKRRLAMPNNPKPKDLENLLAEAHVHLRDRRKLSDDQAFDICIDAVMASLDVENRSAYVMPAPRGCMLHRSTHVGVGLKLEFDPAIRMLRIATPVYQGPAYKAGLRAGDLITHIRVTTKVRGNETWESFSAREMSVEGAEELLKGPEGTRVAIVAIPAKAR